MNVSLFIATRYLRTRRPTAFIAILTTLSVVGVAVGVTALLVVLAVMNGLAGEIRTRIAGTNAHVLLLGAEDLGIADTARVLSAVRRAPAVRGAAPFIYRKALITHGTLAEGLVVKGVDLAAERQVTTVAAHIQPPLAALPETTASGVPGIVLGSELAARLRAGVGDRVVLASFQGGVQSALGLVPKLAPFEVAGIFRSGLYEYDANLAYIGLGPAGDLFGTAGTITGVEVRVDDMFRAPERARELLRRVGGYPYRVTDWIEMNRNLFQFMAIEKVGMAIILLGIVLVAALNIISTLLMVVLVKRRDIGSLMAQGAAPADILGIFLGEGLLIGGLGTALGTALGLLACGALARFPLPIPADVYFISHIPVQVEPRDVLLVIIVSLGLCALAAIYPAWYAARIPPAEAVREA